MGDRYRDELATTRKKTKKSGATRSGRGDPAREARSKAIKRQQGRTALYNKTFGWTQGRLDFGDTVARHPHGNH